MKPRRPIARKTRIKTRHRDKRPKAMQCRAYLDWLKEQPCCVTGKRTGEWTYAWIEDHCEPDEIVCVDPAHWRSRGAINPDLWNALPLAHHLHVEQHAIGKTSFARKYGFNWEIKCAIWTERFLAEHPEHPDAA